MTDQTLPEIVDADQADVVLPDDCFEQARTALAGLPITVASAPVGILRTTFVTLDGITPPIFERIKERLAPVQGTGVVAFTMGRTKPVETHMKPSEVKSYFHRHREELRAVIESDAILSELSPVTIDMAQTMIDHEQRFVDSVMGDDSAMPENRGGTDYRPAYPIALSETLPDVTVGADLIEAVREALGHLPIIVGPTELDRDIAILHPDVSSLSFGSINDIISMIKGVEGIGTICMSFPRDHASEYNQVMDAMMDMAISSSHSIPDEVLFMTGRGRDRVRASEYVCIKESFERFESFAVDLPNKGFDHRAANSAPRSARGGHAPRGNRGGKGRRR